MTRQLLRHFRYLNSKMVDSFLGVIEEGLSDEETNTYTSQGGKGAEANIGLPAASAKVGGQRANSTERQRVLRDSPEMRFDRLIRKLESDPDTYDYEEILDPTESFPRLSAGTMLLAEGYVSVPAPIQYLSQPEMFRPMLDMFDQIEPLARVFGAQVDEMPDPEQVRAMRGVTESFALDTVMVCDLGPGELSIAGKLEKDHLREMPDGDLRVVGKVSKKWAAGQKHSLLALPGASMLSRAQRRGGSVSQDPVDEEMTLRGPALTIDVLAIYR